MQNVTELPQGYVKMYTLDLQKDKKTAFLVNGIALLLALLMAVIGTFFVPLTTTQLLLFWGKLLFVIA